MLCVCWSCVCVLLSVLRVHMRLCVCVMCVVRCLMVVALRVLRDARSTFLDVWCVLFAVCYALRCVGVLVYIGYWHQAALFDCVVLSLCAFVRVFSVFSCCMPCVVRRMMRGV